jgi:ATP-binding cassette, subfamily B, bacterial
MITIISNNKERIKDFFADSRKGFVMVWKASRGIALMNVLLFVLQSILPLLSLYVLKNLIDIVIANGTITWQTCGGELLKFAGLQLGTVIVTQVTSYYQMVQQQLIADEIAAKVLQKAVELDIQYYENPGFYDELHMAQQQSLYRPTQLVSSIQGILQSIITVVILSGFLMLVHWSVIILIVLLGIPMAVSKLLNSYRQYIQDKQYIPLQRKAFDYFHYLTTDVYAKEVRVFDFGKRFIQKFIEIRTTINNGKIKLHKKFLKQGILIQVFEIAITIAIYALIIGGAVTGLITIGGLVIYFQVFQRLQSAITGLYQAGISLFQNQLYLQQILKYLDTPAVIEDASNPEPFPSLQSGIIVKDVDFTYPGVQGNVLSGINMILPVGKVTAIVGENGSGKSTLIKLLCRLYNIDEGHILFDGIPIANISKTELKRNVSVVFQDYGRYYFSLADNIVLDSDDHNADKLEHAIDQAGLAGKTRNLPKGYNTVLGRTYKNGIQLSGGEWQKVAVARGLYKDYKLLILDEPTSAMDPNAEHAIFHDLKKDIEGKIVVLITHRLYNLKLADNIYLMKDGKVMEHGTFDEMYAANGLFTEMYNKQVL